MGKFNAPSKRVEAASMFGKVYNIAIDQVAVPAYSLRQVTDQGEYEALRLDVKQHGIKQPLLCYELNGINMLIDGVNRLDVARELKMKYVPVIFDDIDEKTAMEVSFNMNDKRYANTAIEVANFFHTYKLKYKVSDEDLSRAFSLSISSIKNYLRLLNLPNPVKDYINSGALNQHEGLYILKLDTAEDQLKVAEESVKNRWTQVTLQAVIDGMMQSQAVAEYRRNQTNTANIHGTEPLASVLQETCPTCRGVVPRSEIGYPDKAQCVSCRTEAQEFLMRKYKQKARITGYDVGIESDNNEDDRI